MSVAPFRFSQQRGVSLIEVLISIVIISIVLLGVASLALASLNEKRSAMFRSQANAIAYDIADRMRLNDSVVSADNDSYELDSGEPSDLPGAVNCATSNAGCTEDQQRAQDLREWAEYFVDVAGIGVDGAAYQPLIPNSIGVISRADADPEEVTVTISWQESDWNVTSLATRGIRNSNYVLTFRVID